MLKCPRCSDSNSFEIICNAVAWINKDEDLIELHNPEFVYKLVECNECGYIDHYDKFKVKEEK